MNRYSTSIILVVLALAFACWVYLSIEHDLKNGPLKDTDILRASILASIINPFPKADTFILDTRWELCGNTKPSEMPNIFDTYLDSSVYRHRLEGRLHIPVLTGDEFDKIVDTIKKYRFNGEYPPSLWDTCRIGKVSAGIQAEQLTSTKVRLSEFYQYNNVTKTIEKEFAYKNNNWTFNIVNSLTSANTKN